MSVLDGAEDTALAALPRYVAQPTIAPKTSVWQDAAGIATALPRGIASAMGEGMASGAEVLAGLRYMGDPRNQRAIESGGMPAGAAQSDAADALRYRAREFKPDPQAATTAEQLLYGFARGGSKLIAGTMLGGPVGAALAGAEEANTVAAELGDAGVQGDARIKAALVQGAGLALGALPLAGTTLQQTLALYLAGGPGGFFAQQALTRHILADAGYQQQAEAYNPLDWVGLAVSALVPAPFAAVAHYRNKVAAAVRSLPDLPRAEGEPPHVALPEAMPSELSPIARAIREYDPQTVDAARVAYQMERRAASNPDQAPSMGSANAHEAALSRAEQQMADGERVSVADVAPRGISAAEREANFKAWFGESKVVDESGAPLVVYHGSADKFDVFDNGRLGETTGANDAATGFHFAGDRSDAILYADLAAKLAAKKADPSGDGYGANGVVGQFYLSLKRPLIVGMDESEGNAGSRTQEFIDDKSAAKRYAEDNGMDGIIYLHGTNVDSGYTAIAFHSGQIKSATENSGLFDPNSASLTDPIAKFSEDLRAAVSEVDFMAMAAEQGPRALPDAATIADALRGFGRGAGWAVEGGKILRDSPPIATDASLFEQRWAHHEGDVVGRTKWVPGEEWFGRMRSEMGRSGLSNPEDIRAAIEKAISGEPLRPIEQRTVDWLRAEAQRMEDSLWRLDDAADIAPEAIDSGLSWRDARDIELTSRAAEIDPDGVERAAVQYENDDAAFRAEMQRIVATHERSQTAQQSATDESGSSLGSGRALTRETEAGGGTTATDGHAAQDGRSSTAEAAGQRAGVTLADLDQTQARITAALQQFPDLHVMLDGMDAPVRAADLLDSVRAEADGLRADAPDLLEAAQCAILNGL